LKIGLYLIEKYETAKLSDDRFVENITVSLMDFSRSPCLRLPPHACDCFTVCGYYRINSFLRLGSNCLA